MIHLTMCLVSGNYNNISGIVITKILTYIEALVLRNFKSSKENQNIGYST